MFLHIDYVGLANVLWFFRIEISNKNIRPLIFYGAIFSFFTLLSALHTPGKPFGVLSLLPVCFTIIAAITTRRVLEPLLAGVMAGILLLDPTSLFTQLGTISTNALRNETIVWIIHTIKNFFIFMLSMIYFDLTMVLSTIWMMKEPETSICCS